ncbi:hypothetical protein BaRGS_00016524 [Batillaria attramentaria]|uniref:Uncharacterized protein n=1 Tax=Batillaria attramentaria TaxID=370345 RepID=A0ABD0KYD2_9CAEN
MLTASRDPRAGWPSLTRITSPGPVTCQPASLPDHFFPLFAHPNGSGRQEERETERFNYGKSALPLPAEIVKARRGKVAGVPRRAGRDVGGPEAAASAPTDQEELDV